MNRLAEPDPFSPPVARHSEEELEARWFAAPRRPSIRPSLPAAPRSRREPIDDPVADTWFR